MTNNELLGRAQYGADQIYFAMQDIEDICRALEFSCKNMDEEPYVFCSMDLCRLNHALAVIDLHARMIRRDYALEENLPKRRWFTRIFRSK